MIYHTWAKRAEAIGAARAEIVIYGGGRRSANATDRAADAGTLRKKYVRHPPELDVAVPHLPEIAYP